MTKSPTMITTPAERELRFERIFDAARARVWKAFTEPALVARWWSHGNRLDIDRWEVKRGGRWHFIEHSPAGVNGFEGRYREVVPLERLVRTFEWDGTPGHVAVETTTMEDHEGGKTRVITTLLFHTIEERNGLLSAGMEHAAHLSCASLDALLAQAQF